ncbi:type VI secretion system tip protein VgrG, partial [Aggregatibacter kilianii]|uniref:type VI secretion system tip protein VgrG n=1 Tax=Aggregatibacter kilianii TaxID=2025884 RepID=UPI0013A6693F
MVKDVLSNVNTLSQASEQVGKVADLAGAGNVAEKIHQVQDKISQASNAVSAGKTIADKVKQVAQNADLSSIGSLAGGVGTIADLTGNEKLAAKAAKAQQAIAQTTQAIAVAKDVIHRVQQVSNRVAQSKALKAMNGNAAETMSPVDLLTSLFKRPPSGLQFTLTVNGLPPTTFSVIDFQYTSRYNDLFYLDVSASSTNTELEAGAILDNNATLSIWQDGELIQTISGMVSVFEEGDIGFRRAHYRLQITPDLWRATLRHNSRIFQQKDIQTILSTILAENKVADYAFILRNAHPKREFCVQYQETDFAFLQRIAAEEGIFYYFDQNNGQHRLILTDDAETLDPEKAAFIPYNVNKN